MLYREIYEILKNSYDESKNIINIPEMDLLIKKRPFSSYNVDNLLPGSKKLFCPIHDVFFDEDDTIKKSNNKSILEIADSDIECNYNFNYLHFQSTSNRISKDIIIFFHGLNEKKWDKYLPWAYYLCQKTGKDVILFPIAFHMHRAPDFWSDRREMNEVAKLRSKSKDNMECSFVNAAISTRMEAYPQRLFWTGMETYKDTVHFIEHIREGKIENIDPNASVNLFGYSIGTFLSLILLMGNPKGFFTNSKFFSYCGGMTFDRMYPVSKYILDSQSSIAIQKFFAEILATNFENEKRLAHFQNSEEHPGESWFKTMLRYNFYQDVREKRFKELENQIKSFVLKKDEVAPASESLNTLQGAYRDINIPVVVADYPYDYSHMVPFPLTYKNEQEITQSFFETFDSATDFLK